MELRFVTPELSRLDELDQEILACTLWSDTRPLHGVAGLCDWRLGGRISELLMEGHLSGELGEVVMIPGKPRLPFDKLLLFGGGPRASFDEEVFRDLLGRILKTMDGLASRAGVIQLPGREADLITAERAADILLATAARTREHDVWTLVEDAEARLRINQLMIEERRRVRRVL